MSGPGVKIRSLFSLEVEMKKEGSRIRGLCPISVDMTQ